MRRIFAAGWLCLSLAPLSAESNTPPVTLPLSKLIEQLGDANFRNREAATQAIEARGEKVLPELRVAAGASPSAEARRRLQSLVGQMERAAALEPKYVTLKCKDKPVGELLTEISKQTGYLFQNQGVGNNGTALTYDLGRLPFWQAMDRICDDAHLNMYHNDVNGMYFQHQDAISPHVAYSGPFKVTANSMHYGKTIMLGQLPRIPVPNQNRNESLQFSFNVLSEPKLPIMGMTVARVLEAIDEAGNSMAMPNEPHNAYYYNGRYKTFNQQLAVQLAWPNKGSKCIKRIRMSIPLSVLASQKPDIVVDDILKVKDKKFTGNSVEMQILEVKGANQQILVKMKVRNRAADAAQDYNWTNSLHQQLELHDAKGNKYTSHGYQELTSNNVGNVEGTLMFGNNGGAAVGPPVKLIYMQWVLMQHQIDVEFKDVPLP
jgi:hypothetical protein